MRISDALACNMKEQELDIQIHNILHDHGKLKWPELSKMLAELRTVKHLEQAQAVLVSVLKLPKDTDLIAALKVLERLLYKMDQQEKAIKRVKSAVGLPDPSEACRVVIKCLDDQSWTCTDKQEAAQWMPNATADDYDNI